MAWFTLNKNKQKEITVSSTDSPLFSTFSSPFMKVAGGNLSLPYVRAYSSSEPYIRFGNDNLFPQIINQMYHQSPLNNGIINFKANAVIGGGFELNSLDTTGIQKVKEYTFITKNNFKKLIRQLTKDIILHGRVAVIVDPTGKEVSYKRVGPEQVRVNETKTKFSISSDWSRSIDIQTYPAYSAGVKCKSIYYYEIDGDGGQDIYPIPGYCSALNWCYVDGESSYLHKSNIINSIFPSFVIKLAKKFGSEAEAQLFHDTINKAKGAPEAGRIMTFVGQTLEQLPVIEALPQNNNDKLFTQTDERIDANISRAHQIDPLLMGIRVSGKLGSGNELQQSYQIFEKNVVMPIREMVTEIGDELLFIAGVTATITINNYQIVNEVIVDKTQIL